MGRLRSPRFFDIWTAYMTKLSITVYGRPAPQGSKRPMGNGVMIESSKYVTPWREAVKAAALVALGESTRPAISGPVSMIIDFYLTRPKKPKCPYPDRTPDLSKLVRSTEDALTEIGVWEDDARVIHCWASKWYVSTETPLKSPGAVIHISGVSG